MVLLLASLFPRVTKSVELRAQSLPKAFVFTSINAVLTTRKRLVRHNTYETDADPQLQPIEHGSSEMVLTWQLFNQCSLGFVQAFMKTLSARGRGHDFCSSKYFALFRNRVCMAYESV